MTDLDPQILRQIYVTVCDGWQCADRLVSINALSCLVYCVADLILTWQSTLSIQEILGLAQFLTPSTRPVITLALMMSCFYSHYSA